MSWIKTISFQEADSALKRIYKRVKGPDDNIDNVLLIHSLRPHTLTGHMTLYKSVLHNSHNTLPKWYLETIGVYVSHLNRCSYCVSHHLAGLTRLFQDDTRGELLWNAIQQDQLQAHLENKYAAGVKYAKKLTLQPQNMAKEDVEDLTDADFSEGEVLELNQVISYFNYVNRSVVGLGVNTTGDILGLSPNDSDDPQNWQHQ